MRAKEMLLFTGRRISEIANSCGFDDHAYFSRRFRQLAGMSPLEYRRLHTAPRGESDRAPGPQASSVVTPFKREMRRA
jgi:AraC-like DNA-binding protein